MYKNKVELHGIEESIDRPVMLTVLSGVKKLLGVSNDIKYFLDENETVDRAKSINGKIKDFASNRTEFMQVEHNEESMTDNDLSLLNSSPDTYPIYYDKDVGSHFIPLVYETKVQLNIKYHNQSKSKINNLINRMKLLTARDDMYKIHTLEYFYTISDYVLSLLKNINDIRNKSLGTEVSLLEYIATTFDDRVDYGNTHDGNINKSVIVIREAQKQVIGYVTTDLHNIKKVEDKETGTWYIELEYEFNYAKPISLLLNYPIMIFNNLIHKTFRETEPIIDLNVSKLRRIADAPLYADDSTLPKPQLGNSYISLPLEDIMRLPKPMPNMVRVLSLMVVVDKDNPNELFKLSDIPKLEFNSKLVSFMKSEALYLGGKYKSLVHIDIYNRNRKEYSNEIVATLVKIDESIEDPIDDILYENYDLELSTKEPLDIKGEYRIVFSIVNDLDMIRENDAKRIAEKVETYELYETILNVFNKDSTDIKTYKELSIALSDTKWEYYFTTQYVSNLSAIFNKK